MALQKKRRGPARTAQQRSAWMRKSGMANRPAVQACPNCQAPKVPHRVCMSCGQYNGQTIIVKQAAEE